MIALVNGNTVTLFGPATYSDAMLALQTIEEIEMKNGKLTYEELLKQRNALQTKVESLQHCMEQADRKKVYYHVFDWVAMPLHPVQHDAVVASIRPLIRHEVDKDKSVYETKEGVRTWQTMVEDPYTILPNFNAYLIHYGVDEDKPVNIKVWGLIPV